MSAGLKKAVVLVSGGLDSAVVLGLLCSSLGSDRVDAYHLPCGEGSTADRKHAEEAAGSCGVKLRTIDISGMVDSAPIEVSGMARGNLMARVRMVILYAAANTGNGLVVGTSNKSELLMGYFTKYGDGGADIYPIGDLFKTQVRKLARQMGIPEGIMEKPPSAGLLDGQTDEGEMGMPYIVLDQVLNGMIMGLSPDRIAEEMDLSSVSDDELRRSGMPLPPGREDIERVMETVRRSRHKRMSLAIPKVGPATIGVDLRERW